MTAPFPLERKIWHGLEDFPVLSLDAWRQTRDPANRHVVVEHAPQDCFIGPVASNQGQVMIWPDVAPSPLGFLEIAHGYQFGGRQITVTGKREVLADSLPGKETVAMVKKRRGFFPDDFIEGFSGEIMRFEEPVIYIRFNSNYWHWHIQSLQSLWHFRQLGLDREYRVCLGISTRYQYECLQTAGLLDLDYYIPEPNDCFQSPRLLTHDLGLHHNYGIFHRNPMMRRLALSLVDRVSPAPGGPTKIYVKRAATDRRVMVNQDALIAALSRRGYTCIDPSDYSYAEQIALFAHADIIVGAHGAGLTNGYFAKPGTRLIELLPGEFSPAYAGMARDCDFDYFAWPVPPGDKDIGAGGSWRCDIDLFQDTAPLD